MRSRLELSQILNAIEGPKKVYFQPPDGTKLVYPCIIYNLVSINHRNADDIKYIGHKKYEVIVIDKDPDSTIYESLLDIKYSIFNRVYVSDQLYHYVVNIYF